MRVNQAIMQHVRQHDKIAHKRVMSVSVSAKLL